MTAELGVFFLILALLVALFQTAYLLPALRGYIAPCLVGAAWLQGLCITLAMATLICLRLDNDFSVANVALHSNLSLPLLYKITGAWGNHEGSMLLWVWVVAVFGISLSGMRDQPLRRMASAIQSFVGAGVLLFILFTSNPFARVFPPAADGQMLNPLLQDMALAIHPPMLYLGYIGFSIVFSLAFAAMILRQANREWAQVIHPWILFAWSCLTLGIGLGSWWAYRELGWGGWWFWDPVENASLLPWLAGTALLHSNIVLKKRGMLADWVLLLAIITFGLSLIGTFLVRSGALTSVHSFASDPARGLFILGYIILVIGSALCVFAWRSGSNESAEPLLPVSREGAIIINNLFVLTACATVLLGTMYPLVSEWIEGAKLTVGPPYFNMTFLPLMAIAVALTGFALFTPWKQATFSQTAKRLRPALLATLACALLVGATAQTQRTYAIVGFTVAAWLFASSLQWLLQHKTAKGRAAIFLGHAGAAIMIAGITGVGLWKHESELWMKTGDRLPFAGYTLHYTKDTLSEQDGYRAHTANMELENSSGTVVSTLAPEYRAYSIRNMTTSEADIYATWYHDIYAVIGETSTDGKRTAVRLYEIPMIRFIWAGFILMALGGLSGALEKIMIPYRRLIPLFILLCIVVLGGIALLIVSAEKPAQSPMIGKKIGSFSIPAYPNSAPAFTDTAWKDEITLINFFASWCEACKIEHPALLKLARSKKIKIVGIAWKDKPEKLGAWLAARGNPYQSIGMDNNGRTTLAFGLTGVPETFIVNREGIVVYSYRSALTDTIINREILPLIETLQQPHAP